MNRVSNFFKTLPLWRKDIKENLRKIFRKIIAGWSFLILLVLSTEGKHHHSYRTGNLHSKQHLKLWEARRLTIKKHPELWKAKGLTIKKHPELWEAKEFMRGKLEDGESSERQGGSVWWNWCAHMYEVCSRPFQGHGIGCFVSYFERTKTKLSLHLS